MSLTKWLENQPHYPKFYFAPRGAGHALAGAGIKRESNEPFAGAFGIVSFDGHIKRFIEPAYAKASAGRPIILSPQRKLGSIPWIPASAGMTEFLALVTKALDAINQNQFEKVVLAHQTTLSTDTPINPFDLLDRLHAYIPNAYHYLYQPAPGTTFLGASPEQLYKRSGRKIDTEAQAGTKPYGSSVSELIENPKEQHEHQIVIDNLLSALGSLCIDYGITHEREINSMAQVQHLRTRLAGILRENINDDNILKTLHPTAAVCGWPKKAAFDFIQKNEPFERGFYAGAIGYIDQDESDFAVAIRCALVKDCSIQMFGGAGIVKDSVAEQEWSEIQNKIAFWRHL